MAKSLKVILLIVPFVAIVFGVTILWPSKTTNVDLVTKNESIALLLPHISTASPKRIELIKSIQSKINPTDIFIFSTNHFNSSEDNIIYDNQDWSKSDGVAHGNSDFSITTGNSQLSHELVVNDHGIRNVLSDLSSNFPKANYVSYLIKTNTSEDLLDGVLSDLDRYCLLNNHNCLFVASVDFSHYLPSSLADLHDQFTLQALFDLNEEKVKEAETDSPEVLYLFTEWSKQKGFNSFNLFDQNNTGKIKKDFETEVTSWVIGYYNLSTQKEFINTTLMFAGDIMMDRLINHQFKATGFEHIFDNFKDRVFRGVDGAIANLEGPINDGPVEDDVSSDNLVFNFPLDSVKALSYVNLTGFSLANNHTLNDSDTGLVRTRKILKDNNLFDFGSPGQIDEFSLKELDSPEKIAFIGLNALSGYDDAKLIELIQKEEVAGRFTVIFVHWGSEYQTTHSDSQEKLAHALVDQGVDLIIGSHPHVVQDSEIYKGKLVAYSLGNFVFDQLFSEETQQGVILTARIMDEKVMINFVPVISKQMKVEISKGVQRQQVLNRIMPSGGYVSQEEDGTIILNR